MTANSPFLRRVLYADATISGTTGLLMMLAAPTLESLFSVPAALLRYAGLSLIPFALLVAYCASRPIARATIATIIGLNMAWVVASFLLLFSDAIEPSTLGSVFIVVQAVAVAALAEMQYVGWRRAVA